MTRCAQLTCTKFMAYRTSHLWHMLHIQDTIQKSETKLIWPIVELGTIFQASMTYCKGFDVTTSLDAAFTNYFL